MLTIQVNRRNEAPQEIEFDQACVIGKDASCDVIVKGLLVGRVHARIALENGAYYIEDQGGMVATLVNGEPVTRYGPLNASDTIEIGTATIRVLRFSSRSHAAAAAQAPASGTVDAVAYAARLNGAVPGQGDAPQLPRDPLATPRPADDPPAPAPAMAPSGATASVAKPSPAVATEVQPRRRATASPSAEPQQVAPINSPLGIELRKRAHQKVIGALDLRRLNVARMDERELRETVGATLDEALGGDPRFKVPEIPLEVLKKSVFDEIIGLGPLEELLADDSVSEIMVNCHDEIFIERSGKLQRTPVIFTDDRAVVGAIERIVAPLGRRIDESSPMVDARLADGSRVNAVIPPLALKGPNITIRKFSKRKLVGEDLIRFGSMSPDMLEFLEVAVERRANIIISGGTGSGKTTLLNVLSNFIPDDERIVTVEDAAELQLTQPNLVSLEARPPNMEGKGAVHIRELVKNCLRMRPDRIVVGECRGGEALDMLQAMNTGHDGSLTTAHANSPRDCLARLEVMTLMAGLDLPVTAIREQVSSAIDIIVQQTRFSCGSRRVTHITEVSGMESGVILLQDVFVFKEEGFNRDGKIQGRFTPTSYVPDFYQDLLRRGIPVNTDMIPPRAPGPRQRPSIRRIPATGPTGSTPPRSCPMAGYWSCLARMPGSTIRQLIPGPRQRARRQSIPCIPRHCCRMERS